MAMAHPDPLPFKVPSEPPPIPSIGSDEEESFVVLGHGPESEISHPDSPVGDSIVHEARNLIDNELAALEHKEEPEKTAIPEIPKELAEMEDKHVDTPANSAISIAVLPPDLTSEELQNKISEIIDENVRLKDTILQNNMSMKLQYERIVAWKEDVQKVHEAHKQKFLEAKEYIEKLKKDLAIKDEELKSWKEKQRQTAPRKSSVEQIKLEKSSDENLKQFELDMAHNKIKELEVAVEKLSLENKNMEQTIGEVPATGDGTDASENEIEALKRLLENEKFACCQLEATLKIVQEENATLKEAAEELKKQVEKSEQGRDNAMKMYSIEAERHRISCQNLTTLQYERNTLSQQLAQLQQHLQQQQQQQQQRPSPPPNQEDVYMIRQQLMSSQAALTECQQARAEALVKVGNLTREVERLREEARTALQNGDEIFALQAQLDVYKADFEAERQSKEALREERDRLAVDMQHLHRRNQQLQEQAERVQPGKGRRSGAEPSAPTPSNGSPPLTTYRCPVCNVQFRSLRLLEDHLDGCLSSS